jgi:Mat/Ecp fimbriae major subunit
MTTRFMKAALAGTIAAAAFASTGAQAATATATARAQILQQITVTRVADLDYATIVSGAAASTVIVTPAGARTCGAGLVCTGTATAANFSVVGTIGQVATVSVPATVTLTSGANTMASTLVSSTALMTLAATNNFNVGGTLAVGANQADGAYAGTFTVTVNYQ